MNITHYLKRTGLLVAILLVLIACGTNTSSIPDNTPTNSVTPIVAPPAASQAESSATNANSMLPPSENEADKTSVATSASPHGKRIALRSSMVDAANRTALKRGAVAPNFTYTFADGTKHQLSDLRGKKVMINFWATWCPPCNAEMPDIQKAAELFADNNFVVLGVSQDLQVDLIEPFADQYQITFPLIADPQGQIGSHYGAQNLPTSIFINTDGTVHTIVMGMVSLETIQTMIEQLQ